VAKEILIIENEGFIAGLLRRSLLKKGYSISVLEHDQALKQVRKHKASLVLLEAPALAAEAAETCRFLRETTTAPVIALTDSPDDLEEMDGVRYLVKPVVVRELLASVEQALQRRPSRKGRLRVLRHGALRLDLKTHILTKGKQRYRLTPKEFALLRVLMRNPGKVLSHKRLMREVWKTNYDGALSTLYVHISWLRKKIEQNPDRPQHLRTVRGVGYRFDVGK
jgi:DNA-binding response OmpR family regulator